jgi:hypothetical protein
MNQQITNDLAESVVLAFHYLADENTESKYDEFREYYNGTMLMVLHKHLRWTSGITELGYAGVVEAYKILDELGFTREITDDEIDYIVKMFSQR